MIGEIAEVAEKNAAGTEEVVASNQEQISIINQIADSTVHLAKLSNNLSLSIKKFSV